MQGSRRPGGPDEGSSGASPGVSRRVVLRAGGTAMMSAWLVPLAGCGPSAPAGAPGSGDLRGPDAPTPRTHFLTAEERRTLRALVDRLIPPGLNPGAAAAECDEAIDALLGAFLTDPPLIYAGGPFSDRGGAARNDFVRFVPLDAYEELAWRIAIEGSQGLPEREFNGPVKGRQQIYREGLARLDERARLLATGVLPAAIGDVLRDLLGGTPLEQVLELVNALTGAEDFADLPGLLRDLIVLDPTDDGVQELVDVAFPDTLDAMYGPPEYGGNKDLIGWTSTHFDGDVQPRGYTDAQVSNADTPGLFDALLPPSYGGNPEAQGAAASKSAGAEPVPVSIDVVSGMAAPESLAAMIMGAQGSLHRLRAQFAVRVNNDAVLRWERSDA